jgi:energy-coupling factor transporter ATP-binding protein EcfA2
LSILARFNPDYRKKLSYSQDEFLNSAVGVKFANEFVFRHGDHLFIVGNTGSGKTNRGLFVMDWLKHTENQIWISTAKSEEILPLFFQGKKVRIVIPKGAEFGVEERTRAGNLGFGYPLEIVEVSKASEAWDAAKVSYPDGHNKAYEYITIFEFRQTISENEGLRSQWMIDLFESLAERTRAGTMANIFPCTVYLDEAQWLLAGSRITKDGGRIRNGSIVIENVLEMRSAGCRFVMFAQSYKNIPPAIRDNLLNTILCRGAFVDSEENASLSYHCRLHPDPTRYKPNEGKFVFADGTAFPVLKPWKFPLYPICSVDRKWMKRIRLIYGKKYGERIEQEEIEEECIPGWVGCIRALDLSPEKQNAIIERWTAEEDERVRDIDRWTAEGMTYAD